MSSSPVLDPGVDPCLAEGTWEALLSRELGHEVRVRYGRARRSVLQVHDLCTAPPPLRRPPGRGYYLRMNAFFGRAPEEVQGAVVAWLRSGRRARRASAVLDAWIERQIEELEERSPRRIRLVTEGKVHDLATLAKDLRSTWFPDDFGDHNEWPRLTWGKAGRSRSRHSLRLGSYDYHARLVRIHRVLDQPAVPAWFVRYVLFHELLHAALDGPESGPGLGENSDGGTPSEQRLHHGPKFRSRERTFEDYRRALDWEAAHLAALIRSARTGRPLRIRSIPADPEVRAPMFRDPGTLGTAPTRPHNTNPDPKPTPSPKQPRTPPDGGDAWVQGDLFPA